MSPTATVSFCTAFLAPPIAPARVSAFTPAMPSRTPRRKPPAHPRSPSAVQAAPVAASPDPSTLERSQRNGSQYRAFEYPPVRAPTRSSNPLQPAWNLQIAKANRHYVFVYGTLKKGFANASFLDRATFIGNFRTQTKYPLVVGGRYNSPYLLDIPKRGARVKGEVYAVDDATLADLDHLENVGVNYSRKVGKVANCADRAFVADVFIYFKTNMLDELSRKPFVADYQCRKYVPRHLRPVEQPLVAARR